MKFINDFLENEKQKEVVITKDFPNGTKFFYQGETKYKVLHAWYKPLDDEQIDKLQTDVNNAQGASFVFPEWYRDFFKTTNGLNIFFGSISFFGEQTPLVEHPVYGLIEAGLERENPN
ncbi:MAG: SMI1/KNR4 family protein, partial [Clostridiales bacterium]|nr:SMI1/KNR4 family protein [Clostridiales bacterium]